MTFKCQNNISLSTNRNSGCLYLEQGQRIYKVSKAQHNPYNPDGSKQDFILTFKGPTEAEHVTINAYENFKLYSILRYHYTNSSKITERIGRISPRKIKSKCKEYRLVKEHDKYFFEFIYPTSTVRYIFKPRIYYGDSIILNRVYSSKQSNSVVKEGPLFVNRSIDKRLFYIIKDFCILATQSDSEKYIKSYKKGK